MDEMLYRIKYNILMFQSICRDRCKEETWMNWWQRFIYSHKALICLMLNRFLIDIKISEAERDRKAEEIYDIPVVSTVESNENFNGEVTYYSWTNLVVGFGVFKDWWVELIEDSSY